MSSIMDAVSELEQGYKRCPDCAEEVRSEARRCRFCGYSFEGGRRSGGTFDFLRWPKPAMAPDELVASWGTALEEDEEIESMGYCRLDATDGFLVFSSRRVLFFSARGSRRLLEIERREVAGTAHAGRFGRSRIELHTPGGLVVLRNFVSRSELVSIADRLGVEVTDGR